MEGRRGGIALRGEAPLWFGRPRSQACGCCREGEVAKEVEFEFDFEFEFEFAVGVIAERLKAES